MQSGKGARDTAEVKKIRRTVRMFSNLKTGEMDKFLRKLEPAKTGSSRNRKMKQSSTYKRT